MPMPSLSRSFLLQDKFWLLRKVSSLLRYVAWFVLGAGLLLVGASLVMVVVRRDTALLPVTLGFVLSVAVGFVYLLFASEWIQVMLDIEENTRRSALVLTDLFTRMYPQAVGPPLVPGGVLVPPGVTPPGAAAPPGAGPPSAPGTDPGVPIE